MKLSILASASAAALLAATASFAQSTSTVTQGGAGNEAEVLQTSANQSISTIDQIDNGNFATVDQSDDNLSGFTPANESAITQSGDGNRADVLQAQRIGPERNISAISQSGDGSEAVVRQYGHNDSGVVQTGAGASAFVNQGANGQAAGGNVSDVSQDDDDFVAVNQNTLIPASGVGNYGGNSSGVIQGAGPT